MKIAYITNLRAPYRTLQLNEFSKIEKVELTAYYTDKPNENRKWNISKPNGFKEIDLKGFNILKKFGYINIGMMKIVRNNDLILLGGYEKPTYILISILCRVINKPYVIVYDGISTNRLVEKEKQIKKIIKNIVIKHASYIMGNGTVSKRYFNEVFEYPVNRIYNQFLTVDSEKINSLYKEKDRYRKEYREKLSISENDKVLIYSGRLIDIKNVESVVRAIAKIDKSDIVFLITGGGELEEKISNLSRELGVKTIITGFISEQRELFKHYFVGDALILPSTYEPWGLVVNEAMYAGLPVIVSELCGCSLDLINNNGYIINPYNEQQITDAIYKVLYIDEKETLGCNSRKIIKKWNFNSGKLELKKIIDEGF